MDYDELPGGDLVLEGIGELRNGKESIASLLVAIGAPRLRLLGVPIPEITIAEAEHQRYELLVRTDSDSAHSLYNALVRRLATFDRAAACAGS